ncbi:GntR family transcriptional regulator [Pseudomaricurvus alkylphenolicus]|uniref:GntR family transcriptional regulator n=1 Tax=Pseudomaricurvus alkylphenolicus TaxID=1306991 RepID=UPI00141E8FD9|nr:GntR family transcriptional regulator [Pseudomaricurvus alkylphenolicus]NIB40612.1 GntR family transcriptional regulator [Pseudomaricurvus alkylphenolicus]
MLEKIEAKSLQAKVYQQLKVALMGGHFAPGQVLVIRDLADQLGTSPMPIRQSLHRLVSEHALEEDDKVRSSVRVPELCADVFDDIKTTRKLVEAEAAAMAAKHADDGLLDRLRELDREISRVVEAGDAGEAALANRNFHFAIYEAAGSVTMMRVIESLWLQSGPYFRALIDKCFELGDEAIAQINNNDHILEAMANGDSRAARKALSEDIERAAKFFRDYIHQ